MSPADRTTRPRPQHLLGLSEAEYLVLWGVALHEAGHAVVAVSTGRRFEYVTIRAVEGIGAGHCVLAPLQDFLNVPGRAAVYLKEDIRKQVVCVLAGDAAGTFFGYVHRDAGPLADNEDEHVAERYVKWIAGGAGQWPLHRATEALRRRAQRLVAREEGVIVDVAHALIWRETLSYAEVKAIARPQRRRQLQQQRA